jgi:hypothetical protein
MVSSLCLCDLQLPFFQHVSKRVKTSYLQVGVDVFLVRPLNLMYIQVLKRGYAEQFSRTKPHMNIGTIGVSTLPPVPSTLAYMLQVTLITEKQR